MGKGGDDAANEPQILEGTNGTENLTMKGALAGRPKQDFHWDKEKEPHRNR